LHNQGTYLVSQQLLSLVVSVLLLETLYSLDLLHLELLQLLAVVHGLVDSFVDGHQLLVVLHHLQLGSGFDLGDFNGSVKFTVQGLHLLLVHHLEIVNFVKCFLLVQLEALLPAFVELLHVLLANGDVLAHLSVLDVGAQVVLEGNDFSLEQSHLFHQVLIQLILVNFAALCREQLHFLFDDREDHDLLVLVEDTVTTHVEHINELLGATQPEKVVNVVDSIFKHQADVGFVQDTLLPEVCLLDSLPDLLTFASATDQRSCFLDKFVDFVAGHVCQAGECLVETTTHPKAFDCTSC